MWSKVLVCIALLCIFFDTTRIGVSGNTRGLKCIIPLQTGLPTAKEPIYLDNQFNLLLPIKEFIWNHGDSFYAACPGFQNVVVLNRQPMVKLTCQNGQLQWDNSNRQTSSVALINVVCKNKVVSRVAQDHAKQCYNHWGQTGNVYNVGFQVKAPDGLTKFTPLYKSCFNIQNGQLLYTEHEIYGHALKEAPVISENNRWTTDDIYTDAFTKYYGQNAQKQQLETLLGPPTADKSRYMFDKGNYYFAKGHMVPNADLPFKTWRQATYQFFNIIPQWQIVNNGNWKTVETKLRNYAKNKKRTIHVRTLVYDDLELKNQRHQSTRVYLREQTPIRRTQQTDPTDWQPSSIVAPKWSYKLVEVLGSNERIPRFFTLNNPFATEEPTDHGCVGRPNVCHDKKSDWYDANFINFSKGYTVCCFF